MGALVDEVRALHDDVLAGGGAQYVERHRARGKMLVRERLEALVDPGTPVLELCPRRPAHRRPRRRRRGGRPGRGGPHPVPGYRQRPDRARRHDEPDHHPQAPACHGRGGGEPPPAAAPGRVRRGRPAPPGRRLRARRRAVPPPDAAVGAGHPDHLRRLRLVHRRWGLPPGHERLHGHGRGPGPGLPRRTAAGEDGHRRGGRRGGARRRAHARRDLGPVRLPGPGRA